MTIKIKERLKRLSFHGLKSEDVIRAFLQVDPKKIKEAEKTKYRVIESDKEKK
jgi:guanylate kinase